MRLLQGFISVLALFSVVTAALGQRSVTPIAADKALRKAYAENDLDKTTAFYDDHALMVRPNFYPASGKAVLEKLISWELATPAYNISFHPKSSGIGRPGFAYTTGTYELSFNDSSAKTVSDKGRFSTIWKQQVDGTWKVLNDFLISDNEDANIENFHVKE
jgi:ketosteroid isomerase-like protein